MSRHSAHPPRSPRQAFASRPRTPPTGNHRHRATPGTPRDQPTGIGRPFTAGLAAAALLVAAGLVAVTLHLAVGGADGALPAPSATTATASPTPAASSTAPATPSTDPSYAGGIQDPVPPPASVDLSDVTVSRIRIPAIDVDAAVEPIQRDASGVLLPPKEWADAGWYQQGVLPGQIGPAVIAGHLDTTEEAAVFAMLPQLQPGDLVQITLSNGTETTFQVDRSLDVEKKTFPAEEVYGPTPDAQLRLITCNGPFDDVEGSYSNNYVVFAHLAPS